MSALALAVMSTAYITLRSKESTADAPAVAAPVASPTAVAPKGKTLLRPGAKRKPSPFPDIEEDEIVSEASRDKASTEHGDAEAHQQPAHEEAPASVAAPAEAHVATETKPSSGNVKLPEGRAKRQLVPGHGEWSFYTQLHNLCVTPGRGASENYYNPPLSMYSSSPEDLRAQLPLYWPHGSANDARKETRLGFTFLDLQLVDKPIEVPAACYLKGTTVVMENSVGTPGHIGHLSEVISKYYLWVDETIGRENVAHIWATGLGDFPTNDWVAKYTAAGIGAVSEADAALPDVVHNEVLKTYLNSDAQCESVCFEETCWVGTATKWFYSNQHADLLRKKVWKFCGITPRDPAASIKEDPPVFTILPRFSNRVILNPNQIQRWARDEGFQTHPLVTNMTDFCEQVRIMEKTDVVISTHGSNLANIQFMHPNTVVIEMRAYGFTWPATKLLANHGGINYLEWQNPYPSLQTSTDSHKVDLIIHEDIKHFIRHAKSVLGTDTWRTNPCQQFGPIGPGPGNEHLQPFVDCKPPGYVQPSPDPSVTGAVSSRRALALDGDAADER